MQSSKHTTQLIHSKMLKLKKANRFICYVFGKKQENAREYIYNFNGFRRMEDTSNNSSMSLKATLPKDSWKHQRPWSLPHNMASSPVLSAASSAALENKSNMHSNPLLNNWPRKGLAACFLQMNGSSQSYAQIVA